MNNMNKKIEFLEDDQGIDITITWFTPMAFFLAFFTAIWFGFLIFFYTSLMGNGAPWFIGLFPLLHVAVGVYLAYYTLCLFLNKTYIHFFNNELNIVHQPIPWLGGNKRFDKSEIAQLYVKEKVSNSKNGPQYKYQLMAQMRSGGDQKLLSLDGLSSSEVKEMEDRLEQYMGIPNQPVTGEYRSGPSPRVQGGGLIQQRKHRRLHFSNPILQSLFLAKAGDAINYKDEPLSIAAITQYDWHDGNSDKLLQCFTELKTELNLYIHQEQAILKVYQVRRLSASEQPQESFQAGRPAKSLSLGDEDYTLEGSAMGRSFSTYSNGHTETKQWLYRSKDRQSLVRILDQQGQITYFQGHLTQDYHFEAPLDLNQPPPAEKRTIRRDEEDNNFV